MCLIIKYNAIKQIHRAGQRKKKGKEPKMAEGSDSLIHSLRYPIKNTKLEAIMYTQRTWCADSAGSVSSYELCSC